MILRVFWTLATDNIAGARFQVCVSLSSRTPAMLFTDTRVCCDIAIYFLGSRVGIFSLGNQLWDLRSYLVRQGDGSRLVLVDRV